MATTQSLAGVATGSTGTPIQDGGVRAALAELVVVGLRLINAHINLFNETEVIEIITHLPSALFILAGVWDWINQRWLHAGGAVPAPVEPPPVEPPPPPPIME